MKSGGKPVDTRVTVTLSFLSVEDGIIYKYTLKTHNIQVSALNFVLYNLKKSQ